MKVWVKSLGPTLLAKYGHSNQETLCGNQIFNIGVHSVLLHVNHTSNHPIWRQGGKDMNFSPKGVTRKVQVTFFSPILPHTDCHSGSGMSYNMLIFETHVYKTHTRVLHALK